MKNKTLSNLQFVCPVNRNLRMRYRCFICSFPAKLSCKNYADVLLAIDGKLRKPTYRKGSSPLLLVLVSDSLWRNPGVRSGQLTCQMH